MDMRKYIWNVSEALRIARLRGGMSLHERYRNYGALECALQVVGALRGPGHPFEYREIEVVDDYLFFKHRHRRQENYGELIERLAKEWLATFPVPVSGSKKQFVVEGTEKVRDVIEADDEEQAVMIFKVKYPACQYPVCIPLEKFVKG